jgi:D-alanine-D-alanine ligase
MFCRDKGLCKQLLKAAGLRVPDFHRFAIGEAIIAPEAMRYPVVVKPAFGDGSEGISNASLAHDAKELEERVAFVQEKFQQDVLAEEYIEGREIYVGLLGHTRLRVLPPYEVRFGAQEDGGPVLATYSVKWNKSYRDRWKIEFGFAEMDSKLQKQVGKVCRKAYRTLQLQGYARIDLRLTSAGEIVILEANPNPDITRGEEIAECARKAGLSYENFIQGIVREALVRAD